jgi:hypothetical protein
MDTRESEDRLLEYMASDSKVSAPEGFTQKVMTRATLERVTRVNRYLSPVRPLHIAVAGLVTFCLIVFVLLLPDGNTPGWVQSILSNIPGLNEVNVPVIKPLSLSVKGFDIPSLFVYLSISLFLLTIFDRVLSTYFSRNKERET